MINVIVEKLNLEQLGFKKTNESEYYQNLYIKKVDGAILYLDINIEGNFLYSFGGWISVDAVENLLRPLCQKYNFENYRNDTIIRGVFLPSKESLVALQRAQKLRLNTAENIDKVVGYLKIYLEQYLIPFWEKYANIENINNEIVRIIPQSNLSDYIPGAQMAWKKMIVLKMIPNTGYPNYIEWIESIWNKKSLTEDINNNSSYLLYCELKTILDKQ